KPEQKVFRTLLKIRELLSHRQMILTHCVAAGLRPIESNPERIRLVIVNRVPIVTLFLVPPGRWSIMMSAPKKMMKTKRRHVIYDRLMRREHQSYNRLHGAGIVSERHPRPFGRYLLG